MPGWLWLLLSSTLAAPGDQTEYASYLAHLGAAEGALRLEEVADL